MMPGAPLALLALCLSAGGDSGDLDAILKAAEPSYSADAQTVAEGERIIDTGTVAISGGRTVVLYVTSKTPADDPRGGYHDKPEANLVVVKKSGKRYALTQRLNATMSNAVGSVEASISAPLPDLIQVETGRSSDGEGSERWLGWFHVTDKDVKQVATASYSPSSGSGYPSTHERLEVKVRKLARGPEVSIKLQGSYCTDPESDCEEKLTLTRYCPSDTGHVERPDCLISGTKSSSELKSSSSAYASDKAVDGKLESAWVEGAKGNGKGEWLEIELWEPTRIKAIAVVPGYAKSAKVWGENNRVKSATITLMPKNTKVDATFNDEQKPTIVALPGTDPVTTIRIQMNDVSKGSKFDDTAISELEIQPAE